MQPARSVGGPGFGFWVLGFRASSFEFQGLRISCFVFQVAGRGLHVSDFGFRVSNFGFRVRGFRFQASRFGRGGDLVGAVPDERQ